jgi:uncharacterized membrane protein
MLQTPAPSPWIRRARFASVVFLIALITLNLGWELWWAPLREGGSWWALKVLPLCIPLAGLLKNRMYTYRWLSLMIWLYFIEGSVRATSESGAAAVLAAVSTVLCLALFVSVTTHIRLRLKTPPATETPT